MKYEKDLMASWDEYAIKKTIEHDRQVAMEEGREEGIGIGMEKGMEKGIEKGREKGREEFVRNLLVQTDFTLSKIATLANVSEAFVRKVKKGAK